MKKGEVDRMNVEVGRWVGRLVVRFTMLFQ
jgi:hypothetical protein